MNSSKPSTKITVLDIRHRYNSNSIEPIAPKQDSLHNVRNGEISKNSADEFERVAHPRY